MVHINCLTNISCKQRHSLFGNVSLNRLPGVGFASDKDFAKTGRGTYQEKCAVIDNVETRAVKWMDSRSVVLLSTFSSAEPLSECKRYDKKRKCIIMVPCPSIVQEYNKNMGGVDLMDAFVALYRIHAQSKKFYHKIFYHFLDVTVVNCWILYRRDCQSLKIPGKKRNDTARVQTRNRRMLVNGRKKTQQQKKRPAISWEICSNSIKNKKVHNNSNSFGRSPNRWLQSFFDCGFSWTLQKSGMQSCPCLLLSKMQSAFVHHKK